MADVTWPVDDLKPLNVGVSFRENSSGGGRSLTGVEQVFQPDAGHWLIEHEYNIRTNDQVLTLREMEGLIDGRATTILVPIHDGKRAPWLSTPGGTITATANGAHARGAVAVSIEVAVGGELEAGMHFSAGEYLYRIRNILSSAGTPPVYEVKVIPPLREDIANDATLEFRRPVCRCRLATDDQLAHLLDLHLYSRVSVTFIEDA